MNAINTTQPSLRGQLRTLLDEVRVRIHLAGMDAKDTFAEISKEAERLSRQTEQAAEHASAKLLERLQAFAKTITAP